MDGEEEYVAQLKEVFDDCDSSGAGQINRGDLILLCEKLQVQDHADALVERLIGTSDHKRVGFEEFKDGFVAVLSQCADLLSTEDEVSVSANSYYEEEEAVSPKFVRDGKKYGRRSQPDNNGSDTPLDFADISDIEMDYSYTSPAPTPVAEGSSRKLHTTPVNQGLASVLSPLSDAAECLLSPTDDSVAGVFEGNQLNRSMERSGADSQSGTEELDVDEAEVLREIWYKQGVGKDGYLTFNELGIICENMGMEKMSDKDLHELFDKLDADNDGRVSFDEFVKGLSEHSGPSDMQTNSRPPSSQAKRQLKFGVSMDNDRRTQTPSILSAVTGSGYFSCIDPESTGYAKPEDVIEFWESFCINHDDVVSVLESMAFDLNSRISLQELSSALEQELLNHDHTNAVYQVAIYSCRHELRYIKGILEGNAIEKDKLLEDIESVKVRNEVLIKEADERHSTELKNHESRLSHVEQRYQKQLKSLQSQLDKERELLTSNAQSEKSRLETENSKLREEERALKQELSFRQKEASSIEKELHAHIDKNSVLEKENDRLKRELLSVSELHHKTDEHGIQMEEMEAHRSQLTDEQHRFSEQKILDLTEENKALRDREDELLLELEEIKMSVGRRGANGEGQRSRRGSLLSDYTMTKSADTQASSDQSDVDTMDRKKRKLSEAMHQEEALKLEILKLKDQHTEELAKIKKVYATEKMDLQDAFKNDLVDVEHKNRKLIADFERQLDEEKVARNNSESEWRRKYETERAQLKLAASHDKMELMNKLQEDHREQLRVLRQELNAQCDKEVKLLRDQNAQEKKMSEARYNKRITEYERLFENGTESLRGKLREDFYQLVEEQAQNEIEVEKRHLEASFQTERDELFELLNKEKQSMEDQFNDRLYELEDQIEDVEENVKAECEEEFLEQIQVVQEAFNEERAEYEREISTCKSTIERIEQKLNVSVDEAEIGRLREERDQAFNERDNALLEKNKMMLARNNLEREFEKTKRANREEKATLESQIEELQKLSTLSQLSGRDNSKHIVSPLLSPKSPLITTDSSRFADEKRSLEEANQSLLERIKEAEEEVFTLTTELQLTRAQHSREVQDLKLSAKKSVKPEVYDRIQQELEKEKRRCRELEEALNIRSDEGRKMLSDSQDENYKALINARFEKEEYKNRLMATRKSLGEVTERLKQQIIKTTKSDSVLRELYIENSNLIEALYVTEKRQKSAERRQFKLQTRCENISGAFTKFVPAVMEAVTQRSLYLKDAIDEKTLEENVIRQGPSKVQTSPISSNIELQRSLEVNLAQRSRLHPLPQHRGTDI